MKYADPLLREMLAAEYALGLMPARVRRRFERLLAGDAVLRAEVVYWEERLAQLGLRLAPIVPRDTVWLGLKKRLAQDAQPRPIRALFGRKETPSAPSLRLWQAWSMIATAASIMLAAVLGWQLLRPPVELPPRVVRVEVPVPQPQPQPQPLPATYVAVLKPKDLPPTWAVSIVPQQGRMQIRTLGDSPAGDKTDCELWVLVGDKPISAGLLPRKGEATLAWPADAPFSEDVQMAVSVEPAGGAPGGTPTGPVIATAPLLRAL